MKTDSGKLLMAYVEKHDERAFAELVERHLHLVYATARRRTSKNPDFAKEIAQIVFSDLARKAPSFAAETVLAGWLYRHTCFTASKLLRTEARRLCREQKAIEMQLSNQEERKPSDDLEPIIDDALAALKVADRNALVLRFLEQKSLAEVGAAIGTTENAARMRIDRALEKLRQIFCKRGVTSSSSALAAALGALTSVSPPGGLAGTIAAVAIAAPTAAVGLSILHILHMTKLKTGLLTAAITLGIGTPVVLLKNANDKLRDLTAEYAGQTSTVAALRSENERLSGLTVPPEELARLLREHEELMRLRGDIARFRSVERETSNKSAAADPVSTATMIEPDQLEDPDARVVTYKADFNADLGNGESLSAGGWSLAPGRRGLFIVTPQLVGPNGMKLTEKTPDSQVLIRTTFLEAPEKLLVDLGLRQLLVNGTESALGIALSAGRTRDLLNSIKNASDVIILSTPSVSTLDGRQSQISMQDARDIAGDSFKLGAKVDFLPKVSADASSVNLSVIAELSQMPNKKAP